MLKLGSSSIDLWSLQRIANHSLKHGIFGYNHFNSTYPVLNRHTSKLSQRHGWVPEVRVMGPPSMCDSSTLKDRCPAEMLATLLGLCLVRFIGIPVVFSISEKWRPTGQVVAGMEKHVPSDIFKWKKTAESNIRTMYYKRIWGTDDFRSCVFFRFTHECSKVTALFPVHSNFQTKSMSFFLVCWSFSSWAMVNIGDRETKHVFKHYDCWTCLWLVVSTHPKNISPMGNLPQIGVKIKHVSNHHLGLIFGDSHGILRDTSLHSFARKENRWTLGGCGKRTA